MSENWDISNFLNEVYDDWQSSRDSFPKNIVRDDYWPIPFFGNPATALVATIGVNPSSVEFEPVRRWPKAIKANRGAWKQRLKTYFNRKPDADDWFDPWTVGLALLDCSYKAGTAAHFDISYRPTTAMVANKRTDRKEFGQMVERDVRWLFKLLPLCPNLRVLLTMGPIISTEQKPTSLTGFLFNFAAQNGFKTIHQGTFWELWHEATGKVLILHEADTEAEQCITCRVVKNLHQHRDELRQKIHSPP